LKALLDGDLFAYRCAASAEHENEHIAAARMETLLDGCLEATGADSFQFYVSGPTNFRYQVYPEYKANRTEAKPKYLSHCKQYLIDRYDAQVSDNCEADDLMGIAQTAQTANEQTIIVSLDKDMLQVPGLHYSWEIQGGPIDKRWVKEACLQEVSPIEGLRKFYTQLLTGDSSDNVKGVDGIGKVKAKALLSGVDDEEEMYMRVLDTYGFPSIMMMNAEVLWIMRNPNETFAKTPMGQELSLAILADSV